MGWWFLLGRYATLSSHSQGNCSFAIFLAVEVKNTCKYPMNVHVDYRLRLYELPPKLKSCKHVRLKTIHFTHQLSLDYQRAKYTKPLSSHNLSGISIWKTSRLLGTAVSGEPTQDSVPRTAVMLSRPYDLPA